MFTLPLRWPRPPHQESAEALQEVALRENIGVKFCGPVIERDQSLPVEGRRKIKMRKLTFRPHGSTWRVELNSTNGDRIRKLVEETVHKKATHRIWTDYNGTVVTFSEK